MCPFFGGKVRPGYLSREFIKWRILGYFRRGEFLRPPAGFRRAAPAALSPPAGRFDTRFLDVPILFLLPVWALKGGWGAAGLLNQVRHLFVTRNRGACEEFPSDQQESQTAAAATKYWSTRSK